MKLYTIYLPKKYNDGITSIPQEKISKIINTIGNRFQAYTLDNQAYLPLMEGSWKNVIGTVYKEPVYSMLLFLEDTQKNKDWIRAYKEIIRQDLDQEVIFILEQFAELV